MMTPDKLRRISSDLLPLFAALTVAILGLLYRGELIAWFTGEEVGSQASPATPSASVGDVALYTALNPDPPREKRNALNLELKDKSGAPIDGAEVTVEITMPAMGSMPAMNAGADISDRGKGRFRADFNLAMGGTWNVRVQVSSPKGSLDAEYTLTVGTGGLVPVNASGGGGDGGSSQPTHTYADLSRAELERVLAAYEAIRVDLAGDKVDSLTEKATKVASALHALRSQDDTMPPALAATADAGAAAAERLGRAGTLDEARGAFADLSQNVVTLANADSQVSTELHVFECPMTDGYNKWIQPNTRLTNPYKGAEMLTCGSEVEWATAAGAAAPVHVHDPNDIDHYTCPMDTWVKSKDAGKCPVCGMDLVPVTTEEMRTGVMRIDHRRRQLIGLRTGIAELKPMTMNVRAIGKVVYDQSRLADVTLKYSGFIQRLSVDELGQKVRKGQVLFTVYSPELYTAQQEYLLAVAQREAAADESSRARANTLVEGAAARLRLWDISGRQLARLVKRGKPLQYVPITSPANGYVIEKNVVAGSAIKTGQRLFRVADLKKVWIEAEIYEQDIAYAKVGQPVTIALSHLPGRRFEGKISFMYPYLEGGTRTARARIELNNRDLELKPDMYANVDLQVDLGQRLVIPEAAVIYSGPRRIVFLDIGGDRLRPQQIEVGVRGNGYFEVLSGLKQGDIVITSGNFLLSAETRLKSATGLW